jgi:hypothetical protein
MMAQVRKDFQGRGKVETFPRARVQSMRAAHLTKHHGDEMIPAAESLGCALSLVLPHGASESRAINQRQDLRKTTGHGYHTIPPACG